MRTLVDPATLLAAALAATLFAVTLAFGGVHLWAGAVLQIVVWILAASWIAVRRPGPGVPPSFLLTAIALVAFLAFQLVPLSMPTLASLSPTTAEIYARTRGVVGSVSIAPAPIRPLGSPADDVVSVADREKIRGLAAEARASMPDGAHTIALDPFQARFELLRYVAYGLVLWLAATLPRPRLLHGAIALAGVGVSLLGLVEVGTRNGLVLWFFEPYDRPLDPGFERVLGSFVNADHFAAFVALAVGPTLALLPGAPVDVTRRRRRRNPIGVDPIRLTVILLFLAILAAALLGSGSRGGIIGGLLSTIVVWTGQARKARPVGGWQMVRGRIRKNRIARIRATVERYLPGVLVALVLFAGIAYVGPGGRRMLDERLARTVSENDLEVRMAFWRQTLPMIGDFTMVGTGLGGWSEAVQRYQAYPNVWSRQNHNHNDYLEWLVEVGAVGGALTLLLGLAFVAWARRNAEIPTLVRAGFLGSIVAVAWHEAFDFVLRVPANAVALALILGLLCNRHWQKGRTPEAEVPARHGLRWVWTAAACLVALLLSVQSFRFVAEFLEWGRVRKGDARISRPIANATTWEMLDFLLSRSGFRRQPPTLDCILTAAHLRPTSEQAVYRLSQTLPEGAERLRVLETALFLDPTRSAWRLGYAAELERAGRLAEALFQIEEAVRLDPVILRHPYATASERVVGPEVIAAVERGFRRALAAHGEVPAILSDFATLLHREDRFGEAASLWLRAAEVNSGWGKFGIQAGEAFAREGNYGAAERVLERVIAEVTDLAPAYRTLALDVYQPQGRIEDAERILVLGARRSRDRLSLLLALSSLYRSVGRNADALAAFADGADAAPRDAGVQYQLGVAYLEAGDPHRARSAFSRAIRVDGSQAHFHAALGATQERLNELGEARRAYARAVEIDPATPQYRIALDRMNATFVESRERLP